METAVLDIRDVLLGTQVGERSSPHIPPTLQQVTIGEAAIDSRLVSPGGLFVALRGERVDGHGYLAAAAANGARAALVRRDTIRGMALEQPFVVVDTATGAGLEGATPESVLLFAVDEPLQALHRLAAYHRSKFTLPVIGITGSVGKTSTKEVTAAVLQRGYRTLKNPRSYNSENTLPIVLLQLAPEHEAAVLEMGMYGPGEIALLCELARPRIGIVTNVGPSHLDRLGSIEAIQRAKSELVQALPADGYAILNYDDPSVRQMADVTQATPFFYGLDPAADLWANEIESRGLQGISFTAHHAGEDVRLNLPLIGRHSVHTALAATAAGLRMGLGWDAIVAGLRDESAQLRLLSVPAINGATVIDDTYNASPASVLAALNLLAELAGRRIAVLGDMLELGAVEEESHRMVGVRAAEVVQHLVAVGPRARWIAEEAREGGMDEADVQVVERPAEVPALLRALIAPGDYVLVKGSRGMEMEQIVAAVQQRP
jgi:UDP-N-acetylmuramoyl-tripeptide--D-alanyl-D-alanine ligase